MTSRTTPTFRRSLLHPAFAAFVVVAGAAITFTGCADNGGSDGTAGSGGVGGTMTTAGSGGTAGTGVTAGAGVGGGNMGGAGAGGTSTAGVGGTLGGAGAGGTSTAGVGGTLGGAGAGGTAGMGGAGTAGAGTAGVGMGGAGTSGASGSAGAPTAGMSGSGGGGAEDLDMKAEDFACIGDWDQVLGFRITNLLGHLDDALAVANSDTGGVYPVGTIIQHLPTEAMVKRRAGFSAETKDWEFFILQLSQQGETTIVQRGTTDVQASGMSPCASCHSDVPDEFDFVCNTWGEQGSANCGFDFMDSFLAQQLAGDTRCQ